MVKINDTTSFPNTTPALSDHVPGTDVSNVGNSADGETVTFLLSAIATLFADTSTGTPIDESAWHPYDAATAGDGNDGMLFDYSVDGIVYSVSFTPEAGYDYRLEFEDIGHDSGVARDLYLDVTGTTTAVSTYTLSSSVAANGNVFGFIEFTSPGDVTRVHHVRGSIIGGTAYYNPSGGFVGAGSWARLIGYATDEAIATINLDWAAGRGFVGGKIWLLRRRNYQKG